MEIEHIKSLDIIASILLLDDPGFKDKTVNPINITKEEWVQYLIGKVSIDPEGNIFRIYGIHEDNKIKGYLFAINCMDVPVTKAFMISYQCFPNGIHDEEGVPYNVQALEKVKIWAKEKGAQNISIFLNTEVQSRYYSRYGFKKTDNICMIMEL
jgi:hypothetical protein